MDDSYREHGDMSGDRTSPTESLRLANEASKQRQEETRARGRSRRDIRKAEREQLGAAESASERREIKERFEAIQQGVEEGGIYDVSTDSYTPPEGNVAGADTNMTETGVQSIPRDGDAAGGAGAANEEVFDVVQSDNTAGTRTFLTA